MQKPREETVGSLQLTVSRTDTPVRLANSIVERTSVRLSIYSGTDTLVRVSRTPRPEPRNPVPRPSRAKRHLAWEQIDRESHGHYTENLRDLAVRFPALSPAELRIASLIKAMLPSREIGNRLFINEKTVERHRVSIRRKLGLNKESLVRFLAGN